MSATDLPHLNAALNTTAAILLTVGWFLIRRRRIRAHRAVMLGAFAVSLAFLASYLTYHALAGSRPYTGTGWLRQVYFAVLLTHTVLAAMVPFLALRTLWLGLRRQDERHRAWARWTLPIWMYVSLTGVVVYLMLYRF